MGAAMAPAAYDTLSRFFENTETSAKDYDLILTGDLGYEGSEILKDLMTEAKYDISSVYNDCGLIIYDKSRQDVHAGGSGCGCSASVFCGYFCKKMIKGEIGRILLVCTGALMSPTTSQLGENVVGIAHALEIEDIRRGQKK